MDTFYTIDEKYLQAVDELNYGETPVGLRLLNEIIANDPLHARAHFQLGKIYYYQVQDYQTAGFHFKTALALEPAFPDIYYHYLHLVVFLNMENLVNSIKGRAISKPGVDAASIYELSALFFEKNKKWELALADYRKAHIEATDTKQRETISESLERVKLKSIEHLSYTYNLVG